LPQPALAAVPDVQTSEFVVDHEPMVNCGDFKIFADGYGSTRLTTYFEPQRPADPRRLSWAYNGMMTNSSLVRRCSMRPRSRTSRSTSWPAPKPTSGLLHRDQPGAGAVLIEAGRIVFDGGGPPVFIAGPHRPPDDTLALLCDALR
jgi:hypothetical protein